MREYQYRETEHHRVQNEILEAIESGSINQLQMELPIHIETGETETQR